jgi:hypothetical protein
MKWHFKNAAMIILVNLDILSSAKFWRNVAENSASDEIWIRVACTKIDRTLSLEGTSSF